MIQQTTKKRLVLVLSAVLAFVVSSWLFANWDDFKAGLAGEPEPQAKSHP
jgi:hypothetical protein